MNAAVYLFKKKKAKMSFLLCIEVKYTYRVTYIKAQVHDLVGYFLKKLTVIGTVSLHDFMDGK